MRGALLLGLLWLVSTSVARAQDVPASFDAVETMAAALAAQPYKETPSIQGDMRRLSYDQYRALRAKPDTALWREGKSLFRVEFFPAGFIYEKPVQIYVVENDKATPVAVGPDQFDFSDTGLKQPPQKIDLAGFKLTHPINLPDKFDEVASFLGATYFRVIGRGQVYGASARGLAIDTGIGKPEEFPFFKAFWLLKPADDALEMTVWALLDSPGVAGAYGFTIKPGARMVVDTKAVLYLRNDVQVLGVAPLTSMYFSGKSRPTPDDYRPEIHDSDGLFQSTGQGEPIWRALQNPSALNVSALQDNNPKGFGLLQRERDFERFQDTSANLQSRPSLWVEPSENWGDGEVRLIEIPSQSETNDNIAAFWVSHAPARKGERKQYLYRLSALKDEPALSPAGRVVATRTSAVPYAPKQRRMVIEFAGGTLPTLEPQQPVESDVSLTNAKMARTYVEALPWTRNWRLFIDFEPDGKNPVDMRAKLTLRGAPLTETWTSLHRP
ncbi:MAG: glucan biosynthesis protein [Alphaproteobacteria bacterium]|nr:glucan biosynthesis protein [Alphaproteobacteria bacterium]MBV8407958.1 glucan biosynthesis protein [Alphaproteobacteria bacterium]